MGVLACDRLNCPHIMCDRIILEGSAYICDSCWEELQQFKLTISGTLLTKVDIRERIENFMYETSPGTYTVLVAGEDLEAEFQRLTEGRR